MSEWDDVTNWMDRYRKAWTTNDPADIRALFAEGAQYRYEPWSEPKIGEDAIVASWLEGRDEPGDWTFEWQPVARDGQTVIIQGRTVYTNGKSYRNLWVISLGSDGRASSFTEWYMTEPSGQGG